MVMHFIFLSSSYSKGTRIALDYIVSSEETKTILEDTLKTITEECGSDVSISTHIVHTETTEWKSVCKADSYFEDIEVIKDKEEFIRLINIDRDLIGMDIAKYILSKITCTHLKLEKLVYMCYAEYLCNTDDKLFIDPIYAFKYGPVVDSVYYQCRKYGYKPIEKEKRDIKSSQIAEMPSRSRILFAKDGRKKLSSIDKTLEKYGGLSAEKLVDLTHRKNSPWSKTEKKSWIARKIIEDDIIKEFHKYEII